MGERGRTGWGSGHPPPDRASPAGPFQHSGPEAKGGVEPRERIAGMTRSLRIPAPHGHLEARFQPSPGPDRGVAVVCHPHPRHGGTMHSRPVFRAAQALSQAGFGTLRFNFRGVGTSTGAYGGGEGARDDLRAVLAWLGAHGLAGPVLFGGFSFGARISLEVGISDDGARALFGLGLPLTKYDFSFLGRLTKPLLLVQGQLDEYGGSESLARFVQPFAGPITVRSIQGADHFFNDRIEELQAVIREYFSEGPGAAPGPATAVT